MNSYLFFLKGCFHDNSNWIQLKPDIIFKKIDWFITIPDVEQSISNGDRLDVEADSRSGHGVLFLAFPQALNERGFSAPIQSHHKHS